MVGAPSGLGCQKVVVALGGHHRASDHARAAHTAGDPQHHDDLWQTLPRDRHDREQQQQSRKRHPGIDEALHRQVQLTAEKTGRAADQGSDRHVQRGRRQTNDQRDTRPEQQTAQQVAAQLVGAQQMAGR